MKLTVLACLLALGCSTTTVVVPGPGNDSGTDLDSGTTDDGGGDASDASPAACDPGAKTGAATGAIITTKDGIGVNVRTPKGYDPTVAYPFIMVYSPAGGDKLLTEQFTGLTPDATGRGYIIAYADEVTPTDLATDQKAANTVPAVTDKWCVDPKRIYATGHSNGGSLDEIIALKSWVTLAAVAPSAAGVDINYFNSTGCPKAPLPELEIHSSGDQLFPVASGFGAQVAKGWAKCDGCDPTPSAPFGNNCIKYTGCSSGVEVQYCEGTLAHGYWPTGINKTILDFFDRFTAP